MFMHEYEYAADFVCMCKCVVFAAIGLPLILYFNTIINFMAIIDALHDIN